jgi:hypothetical protein
MGSRELSRRQALRLLVPLLLAGAACGGPRPSVSDVRVTPSPWPGRYRVEAVVRNEARGAGEVSVEIRLHDVVSGRTIQQVRQLQLRGRDQLTLVVDIEAPASTYRADVRATYPPQ